MEPCSPVDFFVLVDDRLPRLTSHGLRFFFALAMLCFAVPLWMLFMMFVVPEQEKVGLRRRFGFYIADDQAMMLRIIADLLR